MRARHDVLIVGAGPAGMAAAVELSSLGVATLVVDEQPLPGGQIWRAAELPRGDAVASALGADYAAGAGQVARFRASGADYLPETRMWHVEPGFRAFMSRGGKAFSAEFRAVLLATGAQERPVPRAGWTLPGVMTVGAAQILLKTSAQIPERPVWIAGSGPLPLLYMRQLLALGGTVAGYLDTTPPGAVGRVMPHLAGALRGRAELRKGLEWLRGLRETGLRTHRAVGEVKALGNGRLEAISFVTRAGRRRHEPASVLLLHEGLVPSIHATLALNCEHEWSVAQGCFQPRTDAGGMTSLEGLYVAGDSAGIAGAAAAGARGRIAAQAIARRLGRQVPPAAAAAARRELRRATAARGFLDALYPPPSHVAGIADDVVICRCEELTAGEIRAAARVHRGGPDHVKAHTRCGMGPCQGRQCGYPIGQILAREYGQAPAEIGFFRIRPPLKPLTLGELAWMEDGRNRP